MADELLFTAASDLTLHSLHSTVYLVLSIYCLLTVHCVVLSIYRTRPAMLAAGAPVCVIARPGSIRCTPSASSRSCVAVNTRPTWITLTASVTPARTLLNRFRLILDTSPIIQDPIHPLFARLARLESSLGPRSTRNLVRSHPQQPCPLAGVLRRVWRARPCTVTYVVHS